jgi:hypothetical protein
MTQASHTAMVTGLLLHLRPSPTPPRPAGGQRVRRAGSVLQPAVRPHQHGARHGGEGGAGGHGPGGALPGGGPDVRALGGEGRGGRWCSSAACCGWPCCAELAMLCVHPCFACWPCWPFCAAMLWASPGPAVHAGVLSGRVCSPAPAWPRAAGNCLAPATAPGNSLQVVLCCCPPQVLDPSGSPFATFQDFWHTCITMPRPPPLPTSAPDSMPQVSWRARLLLPGYPATSPTACSAAVLLKYLSTSNACAAAQATQHSARWSMAIDHHPASPCRVCKPPRPACHSATRTQVPQQVSSLAMADIDWFFTPEQEAAAERLAFRWQPGWRGGHAALDRFLVQGLQGYRHDKARTDRESTTMLSPWVHIGSVSVRCAVDWLLPGVLLRPVWSTGCCCGGPWADGVTAVVPCCRHQPAHCITCPAVPALHLPCCSD